MQIYYDNLLTDFCSKDGYRPGMMVPKTEGNSTYASEAHFFIEIPNHLLSQEYPGNEKSPNFQMALGSILLSPRRSEPLLIDKAAIKLFFDAHRTKVEYENCEQCGGEGTVECHCCGNDSECRECDGTGNGKPTGKVTIPERVKVKIGPTYLAAHLLEIIVKASADQSLYLINKPTDKKAALFQFGEIHCGQMPVMVSDYEDDMENPTFIHAID